MKPVREVIDCHRVGTLQVKIEIWLRFAIDIRRLLGLVRVEQFSPKNIEWLRVQDSLIPEIVHLWLCTESHSTNRWQLFYIAKKALSFQCVLCYFRERFTTTINIFEFIIRSWLCVIDNSSMKGKLSTRMEGLWSNLVCALTTVMKEGRPDLLVLDLSWKRPNATSCSSHI